MSREKEEVTAPSPQLACERRERKKGKVERILLPSSGILMGTLRKGKKRGITRRVGPSREEKEGSGDCFFLYSVSDLVRRQRGGEGKKKKKRRQETPPYCDRDIRGKKKRKNAPLYRTRFRGF